MKRSEFVMLLAEGSRSCSVSSSRSLCKDIFGPSTGTGYSTKWLLNSSKERDYRFGAAPPLYKLHVPRDLMDIYLNWVDYLDHEPQTSRVFLTSLQPGFVVIDVGANIGYYTLLAAGAVGPKGRVHAVEFKPLKLEAARTQRQAEQATKRPNPSVRRSQRHGRQTLNVSPIGLTGFSPWSHGPTVPASGTTMDIPAVPLDDVIQSPVHLVKIDVDGSSSMC